MKIEKYYKKSNEKIKNKLLKDFFKKIGKYDVEEDKVICYVDNKKLLKSSKGKNFYNLNFSGFNTTIKDMKEIYNMCNLCVPIYYVIDGAQFDKNVNITSYLNTNIIFKNCIFNGDVDVLSSKNITFENNVYNVSISDEFAKIKISADNLKIINENRINKNISIRYYLKCKHIDISNCNFDLCEYIKFDIETNNVNFNEVNVISESNESFLEIKSNNLNLNNSIISLNTVTIDSKNIDSNCSIIEADYMDIFNENHNVLQGFDCSNFIYDGNICISRMNLTIEDISKEENSICNSRQQLITTLIQIKEKYNNEIDDQVNMHKQNLQKRKIKKS